MKKPKDPRTEAEDKLFARASPACRELLKQARRLKRAADRKAWLKENGCK